MDLGKRLCRGIGRRPWRRPREGIMDSLSCLRKLTSLFELVLSGLTTIRLFPGVLYFVSTSALFPGVLD
jgi:hypothetical protein